MIFAAAHSRMLVRADKFGAAVVAFESLVFGLNALAVIAFRFSCFINRRTLPRPISIPFLSNALLIRRAPYLLRFSK